LADVGVYSGEGVLYASHQLIVTHPYGGREATKNRVDWLVRETNQDIPTPTTTVFSGLKYSLTYA
jgi:hypothetical protein